MRQKYQTSSVLESPNGIFYTIFEFSEASITTGLKGTFVTLFAKGQMVRWMDR